MTSLLWTIAAAGLTFTGLAQAQAPAQTQTQPPAQGWRHEEFTESGFAVQTPAPLAKSTGTFKSDGAPEVPMRVYAAGQDGISLQITVADFTQTTMERQAALDLAVKALSAEGEVKLNVAERIDAQFGRELTIVGKDGSQATVAVFFVNHKLYEVVGKSLPPDPRATSAAAVRFQQSLEFTGLGAEANRPENRPGGFGPPGGGGLAGGGGPGDGGPRGGGPPGRRGPPPAEAFQACAGKAEGADVSFSPPGRGLIEARCAISPQGLVARPLRPPPGGPGGPDGEGPPES